MTLLAVLALVGSFVSKTDARTRRCPFVSHTFPSVSHLRATGVGCKRAQSVVVGIQVGYENHHRLLRRVPEYLHPERRWTCRYNELQGVENPYRIRPDLAARG
jgi:hypothetical protein